MLGLLDLCILPVAKGEAKKMLQQLNQLEEKQLTEMSADLVVVLPAVGHVGLVVYGNTGYSSCLT